jgi:hypothetical protein
VVWTPSTAASSVWVSRAQIIFAVADGAARTGCAACADALWELPAGVAGFEPPQPVMLSMQANTTSTRIVLCRRIPTNVASGLRGLSIIAGGAGQATFDGHPLYTYVSDTAPGQASGNGTNLDGGVWHEVQVP